MLSIYPLPPLSIQQPRFPPSRPLFSRPPLHMSSLLLAPPPSHYPRAAALPPPPRASPSEPATIVIGAGLAGLAAANRLLSAGSPVLLLEASDGVGGRVRTDAVDGFLLDRGFQIFPTAYPEARRTLDYSALALRPFYPGALIFHAHRLHRVADPLRRPLHALLSLPNPIGSLPDKLLVGLARLLAAARPDDALLAAPEAPISARLRDAGFSPSIVDRFFRPFLGGIFFDAHLSTTSRLLDFVFKCLALGDNALPAAGIAAIPNQLAAALPASSLRLNTRVSAVLPGSPPRVVLQGGEVIYAHRGVILATERPQAQRLFPQPFSSSRNHNNRPAAVRSTVCLYFSADRAAVREPILLLNGSGEGIVNNMCFPSNVAPSYAPEGKSLVSVSLIGEYPERSDEDLAAEVVRELSGWFGQEEVGSWRHLRTYRIGFAQPDQTPPTELVGKDPRVAEGVYVCGDHWSHATFDGALVSGRLAADALIRDRAAMTVG